PNKLATLEAFLAIALTTISIVPTPDAEHVSESAIRDVMDRPILRAAINASADVLLTGDRDFLESGLSYPRIMTATDFLQL
ncbi:MAG: PIN domain-containing protein, partial [Lachnospiraceae bacterium]|nr:PIN domain-containing protein [Lachnospiraceae bacterium]